MTVKIWTNKVARDKDFTEADIRQPGLLKGLNLTGGKPLAASWPKVVLDVTSEFPPADTFLTGPMLIVSERLGQLILKNVAANRVEYLPVEVMQEGKLQGKFGMLNVLDMVDALDRENSEFTELDGVIDMIDVLAIDDVVAGSKAIFQLDAVEWVLCLNNDLSSQIETAGFTGVVFKEPAQWRPY